ncbi:ABC transporter [Veillonella montpellierensis DNF00314]|uniref:ABC transporter n=1 Tax=Veillonella montpellierensis DNF00314 TaxID=1401067 RepID=A0A096ANL1_9FIRM|nr:ABC-F family ATP-binding cassette domain-containing protein [Veillonella montpellierensis]KGF48271.1 ABC transporter [Veillonella montpellierensis DNF00314]
MERIQMIGLEKSFGIDQIFSNVSFEIKQGERIGLVGPNGAGKSTLMKCILGLEELDKGQVVKNGTVKIGYLQQDVNLGDSSLEEEIQSAWADIHHLERQLEELTSYMACHESSQEELQRLDYLQNRLEWFGGYEYELKTKRIIKGLGFSDSDLRKSANEFSGGQKTRINLAKALVRSPDFLFLDEPTNHLDMDMLEWLENYLSSYKGGILVISHDRYFLDHIVTSVVELEQCKINVFKGNYTKYINQRAHAMKAMAAAYEKQQEYIKKTEAYIDKYRAGIKSKMARGRQSQLNRLERIEAPVITEQIAFTFPKPSMSADKVLILDDVTVGYDRQQPIASGLSTVVRRGETVALIGPNGAGKSTLVKTIMGDIAPIDGTITVGNRVEVGYFSQEHETLHPQWQVIDEVKSYFDGSEEKARHVLGRFLFRGDDVFKRIKDLSGGEQARVALLKIFLEGNNFLILDEPTNHLDIGTREVVEKALQDFEGTCFVISHDRYFLDQITTRTLALKDGHITEYIGNYSYYKEKIKEQEFLSQQHKEGIIQNTNDNKVGESTISTRKKLEDSDDTSIMDTHIFKPTNSYMAEKKIGEVEMNIARAEATIKMYETQLMDPALQSDIGELKRVACELEMEKKELDHLYEVWETLMGGE